jgi:hypothetical protein
MRGRISSLCHLSEVKGAMLGGRLAADKHR